MADTICITGASGFLGRHLTAFYRTEERSLRLFGRSAPPSGQSEWVKGDLVSGEGLDSLVTHGSVVVHLAYMADRPEAENLRAARSLAETAIRRGAKGFVHCSTAVVVGAAREAIITEETPCRPISGYERTKCAIEQELTTHLNGKVPLVIVRPTAVFGPGGKNLLKLIAEVCERPAAELFLKSMLYGRRRLNLVAVENVVSAIAFAAQGVEALAGNCYIVSDDEFPENNYYDTARLVACAAGRTAPWIANGHLPPPLLRGLMRILRGAGADPFRQYSSTKLVSAGWQRPVGYVKAVERFVAWHVRSIEGSDARS